MSNVLIVGATGAVGKELMLLLESRVALAHSLRVCASPRSVGKDLPFRTSTVTVEELSSELFTDVDVVFFAADSETSLRYAPEAVRRGCKVIDNSSAFRMRDDCPLVIPEVNIETLRGFGSSGIIANPNCSTIIGLTAIAPLRALGRISRISMCTYQAISGAGAQAMAELEAQTKAWAAGKPLPDSVTGRQLVFNCFSHESVIGEDGMNVEERKFGMESRRILNDPNVLVSVTCMRVPVLRAHTEAIHLEFDSPVEPRAAYECLQGARGVCVVDSPEPIAVAGCDDVHVGRIRRDHGVAHDRGLSLLVTGDQLRKGAALNAVQIAEYVCEHSTT